MYNQVSAVQIKLSNQMLKLAIGIFAACTISFSANSKEINRDIPSYEQLTCLATNIYFEARNQPLLGQLAIAKLVINRVNSPKFPDTICGVIHQGKVDQNGNPILHKCQFSWYCDGKSDTITNKELYNQIVINLVNALSQPYFVYLNNDIIYYHNDTVRPSWIKVMEKELQINDHIFYSES